jgi:hypothetical protein
VVRVAENLDQFRNDRRKAGGELQKNLEQNVKKVQPWDRCYDLKNIFAEKFGEKIGIFDSKQS